ncbi:MAG: hypothetical protein NZ455_13140 [Bacteroidia bacterium]|nr:hypothetical protein [Bacteroidia bacterium]MDW8347067.1 hypothetical protein [Bacteroidia bacterium]
MYKNEVKHQNTACVRDTKHAVRQCGAVAKHRSARVVRSSPTRAQRGTRPKSKPNLLCYLLRLM